MASKAKDDLFSDSFQSIYKNQNSIQANFEQRCGEINKNVGELAATLRGIQTSAAARQARDQKMLQNLDVGLVDKIEIALEEHEQRMRTTAVVGGLFLAVAAPAAMYLVNKLL